MELETTLETAALISKTHALPAKENSAARAKAQTLAQKLADILPTIATAKARRQCYADLSRSLPEAILQLKTSPKANAKNIQQLEALQQVLESQRATPTAFEVWQDHVRDQSHGGRYMARAYGYQLEVWGGARALEQEDEAKVVAMAEAHEATMQSRLESFFKQAPANLAEIIDQAAEKLQGKATKAGNIKKPVSGKQSQGNVQTVHQWRSDNTLRRTSQDERTLANAAARLSNAIHNPHFRKRAA